MPALATIFFAVSMPEVVWRGPDLGLKVDLSRLKGKDGKTLASVVGNKPIMVAVTNPDCGLCRTAADEMALVRSELTKKDINYYILFFPRETPATDFFKYSDSLQIGAESFLWDAQSGPPLESIFTMTTPSHMLVNSDGTVIRVWPGSSRTHGPPDSCRHLGCARHPQRSNHQRSEAAITVHLVGASQ